MEDKRIVKQTSKKFQENFFDYDSLNQLRESALGLHFIHHKPIKKQYIKKLDPFRLKNWNIID